MAMSRECVFCEPSDLEERIIRRGRHCLSIVSNPWFRAGHSLVIPERHIATIAELRPDESVAIMAEIGRISLILDDGFGTGLMQKYQPLQSENGIKVNHLHFHIFPRQKDEENLFPAPEPNSFRGFSAPSSADIQEYVQKLS
jgi:ATP adenylyltransferase